MLVTGCSSGIGAATARAFDDAGWEVYATARDPGDLTDLEERGCPTARLDVTDDDEVAAAVDRVFEESGRLDCLVNNAGYGQPGPVEDVPIEEVRAQFDVNTFGPLRLVRAALPRMRERGEGTIVNVGAGMGNLTPPGLGIYTGSKFALHSVSDALRQEVSPAGIDVVLIEPGIVATGFVDRALEELDEVERSPAHADLYRVLGSIGPFARPYPGINRPERVARTILEAATADRPDPVYRVGPLAEAGTAVGALLRGRLRDRVFRFGLSVLASDPVQRLLPDGRGGR